MIKNSYNRPLIIISEKNALSIGEKKNEVNEEVKKNIEGNINSKGMNMNL